MNLWTTILSQARNSYWSGICQLSQKCQTIQPKGLDTKRQWYLYDKIRPFTAEHCQDITTPLPAVANPVWEFAFPDAISIVVEILE